jgi:hypothetical protein
MIDEPRGRSSKTRRVMGQPLRFWKSTRSVDGFFTRSGDTLAGLAYDGPPFWSRRRSQSGGGFRISFCCLIHSCASSSLAKYVRVETQFGRVTLT